MSSKYADEYDRHLNAIVAVIRPVALVAVVILVAELVLRYQHNAPTYWQWVGLAVAVIVGLLRHTAASIVLVTGVSLFYVFLICVMWIASVIEYCAMAVGLIRRRT